MRDDGPEDGSRPRNQLEKDAEHWREETHEALIGVRGAQARLASVHQECLRTAQDGFEEVFGGVMQLHGNMDVSVLL